MHKSIVLGLLAGVVALAAVTAMPAGGKVRGQNGRIAFALFDPALDGTVTYTANPDGSHVEQLFSAAPSGEPRWSPDGSEVAILAPCTDGEANCAATIVDPDTGTFRQLKMPDPTLFTGCLVWSPDRRLACEGFGEPDSSRNGIYTIRSSDGGGLTRMTSNPGGDDLPGDYSPDGKRLVFARFVQEGDPPVGLFVVKTDGGHLRRITPPGTIVSSPGDWSPQGNAIVFARRVSADKRNSLWVVHSDGSGLREIRLQAEPACGGAISDPTSRGCIHPRWSPDGKKIIFSIFTETATGEVENVYTVNADGTGLTQITHGGGTDGTPDWGTHPLAP